MMVNDRPKQMNFISLANGYCLHFTWHFRDEKLDMTRNGVPAELLISVHPNVQGMVGPPLRPQ